MSDPNEIDVVQEEPVIEPAEQLTFADGSTVEGHVLPDGMGIRIYVYLDGMSLADGYTLMNDPEKTGTITALNHGETTVYEGYTEIIAISTEFGNCNVVMRKVQA